MEINNYLTGIFATLYVVVLFQVFRRLGRSGWLALTQIIPFAGLIVLAWVAYGDPKIKKSRPKTQRERVEEDEEVTLGIG